MTKKKTKTKKKAKKALAKAKSRTPRKPKKPELVKDESNNDGRLNLRIDPGLKKWAQDYADRNSTTVTQIVNNYFTRLRAADEDRLAADAEQL